MKGQQSGWLWVRNYNDSQSFATTVQVHNRTVLAEVAAVHINVADDERHRSIIYISQVVARGELVTLTHPQDSRREFIERVRAEQRKAREGSPQ